MLMRPARQPKGASDSVCVFVRTPCDDCACYALVLCCYMWQAEKRRETLLVGLNKTKEQLSGTEERYKSLQLDMQRTQMDLLAKTSTSPLHIRQACMGGFALFTVHTASVEPIICHEGEQSCSPLAGAACSCLVMYQHCGAHGHKARPYNACGVCSQKPNTCYAISFTSHPSDCCHVLVQVSALALRSSWRSCSPPRRH